MAEDNWLPEIFPNEQATVSESDLKTVVSRIEHHAFCDKDVKVERHENDYSVGFKIEYKCHVTIPNEYAYMFLNKDDVIALAKHLKVNVDDLSC